jgi:hypothetical protein
MSGNERVDSDVSAGEGLDSLATLDLISFVSNRDVECPGCGYNLRGLRAGVCPECQQELSLRVGLAEPKNRLWLTALIGAACGLGFNGLLTAYAVFVFVARRDTVPQDFVAIVVIGLVFFLVATLVMLRKGRSIRRLSVSARAGLAVCSWGAVVVSFLVFSTSV